MKVDNEVARRAQANHRRSQNYFISFSQVCGITSKQRTKWLQTGTLRVSPKTWLKITQLAIDINHPYRAAAMAMAKMKYGEMIKRGSKRNEMVVRGNK